MLDLGVLSSMEIENPELDVILQNQSSKCAEELVQYIKGSNRRFSLHFIGDYRNKPMMDLITFSRGNVRKQHFQQSVVAVYQCFLLGTDELPSCPHLTHLSMESPQLHIEDSVFEALSKAVQEGTIPNLSHLSFADGGNKLRNKIPLLFQTQWLKLTHLDLTVCALNNSDIQIVFGATNPEGETLLHALSSLAIDPTYFTKGVGGNLLQQPWTNLINFEMINRPAVLQTTPTGFNSTLLPPLKLLIIQHFRRP